MYRASNGIMSKELSEAEAREHYDSAQFVSGKFGEMFVTCPVGEHGRVLLIAATTYTPIREKPGRKGSGQEKSRLEGLGWGTAEPEEPDRGMLERGGPEWQPPDGETTGQWLRGTG